MPRYRNFVPSRPNDLKMADICQRRHIAAAACIAEYGGHQSAPADLVEYELNNLTKLLYWEEKIKSHKHFDLGAEMAKYEPSGPTEANL